MGGSRDPPQTHSTLGPPAWLWLGSREVTGAGPKAQCKGTQEDAQEQAAPMGAPTQEGVML